MSMGNNFFSFLFDLAIPWPQLCVSNCPCMAAPHTTHLLALIACSALSIDFVGTAAAQAPAVIPPKVPAPGEVMSLAALNRLLRETDDAFAAKDFNGAIDKMDRLIKALGPKPKPAQEEMLEMLMFNTGLAHLLADRQPEAEAAFTKCVTRFPKGAYTSRCYLGIGKSCVAQDKKDRAVVALKTAMTDWKYSSEAGLLLAQLYSDMGKRKEALIVFRSLMGADVATPQQTTAAVGVIDLLADNSNIEELVYYLDRLMNMAGVRDSIAWYANQVSVRADKALLAHDYETALAIYQTVPTRKQIIQTQTVALDQQRKKIRILENTVEEETKNPERPRSVASELLGTLRPGLDAAQAALTIIEGDKNLDAALVMRRGRCLYHLKRYEEARVCFSTMRIKYPTSKDAQLAAFGEISIMDTLKKNAGLLDLCNAFLKAYPDSEFSEQVGTLAGELLVQTNKWKDIGPFYQTLENRFPKSVNMDRFIFYQALSAFMDAEFATSTPLLEKLIAKFPKSLLYESALYHVAMTHFLSNEEKKTKAACAEYLTKYPKGLYAGDMQYRLSFIDSNDKKVEPDKIITDLEEFMKEHPTDVSNASMLCLLADTYKKKFEKTKEVADEDGALEAFKKAVEKAVEAKSPDDVIQYSLDSATAIMQGRKDWNGIAELHGDFLRKNPDNQLALLSAGKVVQQYMRMGKGAEGAALLASTIKARAGNPAVEQVEYLIDELVKTLVPKKKPTPEDEEALDNQLVEILTKVLGDKPNPTATARTFYARARLSQLLNRSEHTERSDLLLKGVATNFASDPSVLSPTLLSACGDILLNEGDLDGAEAMYKRLDVNFKDSMFADSGPYGLGLVALARKQPDVALNIFENTLKNNKGTSKFKETTLAKLNALIELGEFDSARTLADEIVGDKNYRGELCGKALLLKGQSYRSEAAKAEPGSDEAKKLLAQAHGVYQHIYVAYQGLTNVCAEAYWQAYETAKEMNEYTVASETLKALTTNPKLKNTMRAKEASKLSL